jgi:hypothetical protein
VIKAALSVASPILSGQIHPISPATGQASCAYPCDKSTLRKASTLRVIFSLLTIDGLVQKPARAIAEAAGHHLRGDQRLAGHRLSEWGRAREAAGQSGSPAAKVGQAIPDLLA